MSTREENKDWLEREAVRRPDSWEAEMIELYGMAGALDLLAAQEGKVQQINLTHRPFSNDPELKDAVYAARAAVFDLGKLAYARLFADLEAQRAEKQ